MDPFGLVSLLISVLAVGIAYAAFRSSQRALEFESRQRQFETYFEAESSVDPAGFLKVHEIDPQELTDLGLTPESFLAYLRATNLMWRTRMFSDSVKVIEKQRFASFEEGLRFAIENRVVFPETTQSHRVVRSEGFSKAWPLISLFWSRTSASHTTMIIEATKALGILSSDEARLMQSPTPGDALPSKTAPDSPPNT